MDVRRTTSGAYVAQLGEFIVKLGDGPVGERIGLQADWLIQHAGPGVMPVLMKIGPHAYVMPVAAQIPDGSSARSIFDVTYDLLQSSVWSRSAHHADEARGLFARKLASMEFGLSPDVGTKNLWDLFNDIVWSELPRTLTHGDPTFCNVMRIGVDYVLCDPIPSGTLPDVRALDLGKMLQSCMGFEEIVYGWRYSDGAPNAMWVLDECVDDNERAATIAFCALHILRLLPYVGEQFHKEFTRVFDAVLRLRS